MVFTQAKPMEDTLAARDGIRVITVPDIRWARRDIKTVQLLAPSMCKMMAKKAGKDDAWMVEDGFVTEGTSNNAWIVTRDGRDRHARPVDPRSCTASPGRWCMEYAAAAQMPLDERPFTVEEARGAAEAFMTAASAFVTPVVEIDGVSIGDGRPGPVARRLRELYLAESRRRAG